MTTPAKDRLNELLEAQTTSKSVNIDVEGSPEIDPKFKEIFDKVYKIRILIGNIKENTKKSRELIKASTIPNKVTYGEIESRYKDTLNICFAITNELRELDVKPAKKDDNSDKCALARVKRLQYASLRQDFQNALFESNDLLENYREQRKNLLKRQAALVNTELNDDELESLLENSDVSQFFTGNILLETRIARDELALIEERHAELLKIESMLVEVNDLFKRVAILIEQQKENVNRIEYHAGDAINYVDKGLIEIERAEKLRKKNKKMLITVCIALLVTIIIVLCIFH